MKLQELLNNFNNTIIINGTKVNAADIKPFLGIDVTAFCLCGKELFIKVNTTTQNYSSTNKNTK